MTAPIEPALTPDEWRDEAVTNLAIMGDYDHLGADYPGRMQKVMAIVNNALPDDSPYKITRSDVELMDRAAYELRSETGGDDEHDACRAERLAAKLAALLPPEKAVVAPEQMR